MKLTQLFKAAIEPPKKIYNVGLCHESAVRQDCSDPTVPSKTITNNWNNNHCLDWLLLGYRSWS